MSIHPLMAAVLAAVALVCVGYIFYRVRIGHVRHGAVVCKRSDSPVEFWLSILFPTAGMLLIVLALATDMGPNDFHFDQSVTWALGAVLIGFLLFRALQTGRAGGHQISFARREEPREYWINHPPIPRPRSAHDLHALRGSKPAPLNASDKVAVHLLLIG